MLCGDLSVLQASMLDGLAFDPFALFDDGLGPAEVGVGRCDVVEALVVAPMVATEAIISGRFEWDCEPTTHRLSLRANRWWSERPNAKCQLAH